MPISDEYARLPLAEIIVKREERQRRELNDKAMPSLMASIKQHGVLEPLVITRQRVLVAGERRLEASRLLGLPDIPIRWHDQLDQAEVEIIELEENVKRQDLEWQDLVRAVARIHQLYQAKDSEWTMGETAAACSLTTGTVSIYLRVHGEMVDERIKNAATVREAYNIIGRRDQRAMGDALEELTSGTVEMVSPQLTAAPQEVGAAQAPGTKGSSATVGKAPARKLADHVNEVIICESFLHWAPKYKGPKFNVLHCDFPYGISLFDGPQAGGDRHGQYDDSKETYFALLKCFCQNLDHFMSMSAHLLFWYSDKYRDSTMAMFKELAPSIVLMPYPLIWVKSDNAGIASDARRSPRHIYETCLFGARGGRNLVKIAGDAYSAPTDKRFHVSTKPEPMLRHFMQMVVDENSSLLDPTCGSASSLRAAESLGAKRLLGMDVDERTVGAARQAMRQGRMLANASKDL